MSAAAAETAPATPPKGGKKKLIVIAVVVLVLLLGAGAGAVFYLKGKAAARAAAEAAEDGGAGEAVEQVDAARPPTFLSLDPFVVNLVDREVERYAQIGIVLEVENAVFAEQMKGYMPAIRNSILMILAHKTSVELLGRSGKEQLAEEIARETVRPMGIHIAPRVVEPITAAAAEAASAPAAGAAPAALAEGEQAVPATPASKARAPSTPNPVRRVHFSSFIIQ